MNYLIDTNVISEVRKGPRCDSRVAAWYGSIADGSLFLSVLVIGEIRSGVERARKRDAVRAAALDHWLADVQQAFGDRILPIDHRVANEWGRLAARRPLPVVDGLLAATAKVHGLTLVTRNVSDVEDLGASILDPFSSPV